MYHVQATPPALRAGPVADLLPNDMLSRCPFAPAAIIGIFTVFERNMYRYREPRTYRSVHLDAGHILGTVELLSRELGFRHFVQYGADEMAWLRCLGLDPLTCGFQASVALSPE